MQIKVQIIVYEAPGIYLLVRLFLIIIHAFL
jgi:hypothetical protein